MRKSALAAALGLAVPAVLAFALAAPASTDDGTVRIMTQNVDEGTDFIELVSAQSPAQFVAAVTTTYQNILATKPAERAAAIAREIARERPDLVALQEASILRAAAAAPATTVQMDLLQSLMAALATLGEHYAIIAIVPNLDAEAPSTLGFDVRITTQDAILLRKNGTLGAVGLIGNQVQRYLTGLVFQTPVGPFPVPRGWASVDVSLGSLAFRFATTHLETSEPTQLAQMKELLLNFGAATPSVVMAGDFNARADAPQDPTFQTYQAAISAGFVDAWSKTHPFDPGYTCCQAPNLMNAMTSLNQRIDLVLFRGGVSVVDTHLIGAQSSDRTPSGLWPSDHAGVVATLRFRNPSESAAK
jgi:endonuclease/exonuclease/phosphatase family metal-dependent hydrolase